MLKSLKEKSSQFGQKIGQFGQKLGQKIENALGFHKLSEKNLHRVSKGAKVMALLSAGHAGIWLAIGVVGATAMGLHAAGFMIAGHAIPAIIGTATLATGALLTVKAVVFNRMFAWVHRKCQNIQDARTPGTTRAPEPEAKPGAVAKTPALRKAFNLALAPTVKAPAAPPPPAPKSQP
jgi:hypothetical protein